MFRVTVDLGGDQNIAGHGSHTFTSTGNTMEPICLLSWFLEETQSGMRRKPHRQKSKLRRNPGDVRTHG